MAAGTHAAQASAPPAVAPGPPSQRPISSLLLSPFRAPVPSVGAGDLVVSGYLLDKLAL
jgi:hypothetical protein